MSELLKKAFKFLGVGAAGAGAIAATAEDADAMTIGKGAINWDIIPRKFSSLYDKLERAEISDKSAKFVKNAFKFNNPDGTVNLMGRMKLGQVFEHPKLFKQYPELKNMDVFYDPSIKESKYVRASKYNKAYIKVADTNPETMLHELQHVIQHKEGFNAGGNMGMFKEYDNYVNLDNQLADIDTALQFKTFLKKKGYDLKKASYDDVERYILEAGNELKKPISQELVDMAQNTSDKELIKLGKNLYKERGINYDLAMEQYKSIGGEIEARNTAERFLLSNKERQTIPNFSGKETINYPPNKAIINYETPETYTALYSPQRSIALNTEKMINRQALETRDPIMDASLAIATAGSGIPAKIGAVGIDSLVGAAMEYLPDLVGKLTNSSKPMQTNLNSMNYGFY